MATVITNVTELQAMEADLDGAYELGNDIDASATVDWNGGVGFLPIGQAGDFTGSFDGKGYVISNITINRSGESSIGLFSQANNCVIANFGMEGGTIVGDNYVGAIAGRIYDSVVSGVYSTIDIDGDSHHIGGLFGQITISAVQTTIIRCYSTGDIRALNAAAANTDLGGFAGSNTGGILSRCFATGDVYSANTLGLVGGVPGGGGGFIGSQSANGDLLNCYARGSITAAGVVERTGGFCGNNTGGSMTNCYSTGAPSGAADVGGFLGRDDGGSYTECFWDKTTSGYAASAAGTGKTTAQMKDINTILSAEWSIPTIWNITSGCNNDYPCLVRVNLCCAVSGVPPLDPTIAPKKVTLELLRNLEIMNLGRFFVSKSGNATYESRFHR